MIYHGLAASPGIAIGPVFLFQRVKNVAEQYIPLDLDDEWLKLQNALNQGQKQLEAIYDHALRETGKEQAEIFEAQRLMLTDPELQISLKQAILIGRQNSQIAVVETFNQFGEALEKCGSEYFSARASDIRDVGNRILRILQNVSESTCNMPLIPSVLIADELSPSDTVILDKRMVLGFVTACGGTTSHSAILARELGIPAVVGVGPAALNIIVGSELIINGDSGEIIVNPESEVKNSYLHRQSKKNDVFQNAKEKCMEPACTSDGHRIHVVANIANIEGARKAVEYGAEGVGLFRTEGLFLERSDLPSEEEQYQVYSKILNEFGNCPVILRTLDIGGDKNLPYLQLPKEDNPFLGVRAIRLSFSRPELFNRQIRAALRASTAGNLRIMLPMIATREEIQLSKRMIRDCRNQLQSEGYPVAEKVEIGIMVEIPAAAILSERLAQGVDFFSIGTNDLSQYTMAADRTNPNVASLASAFQPAVLRLIAMVVASGHKYGIPVGVCGGLASEPEAIPILVGMGIDELSMNPPAIPMAKQIIHSLCLNDMADFAKKVIDLDSPDEVKEAVWRYFPSLCPESN
jgi:phosphoenolpyruvate-protein phosphotransferase (PTS system enzyme I)